MIRFLLGLAFTTGLFLQSPAQTNDPVLRKKLEALTRAFEGDNTASLWCQLMAGTGTTINRWFMDNGFAHTNEGKSPNGRPIPRLAEIRVGTNRAPRNGSIIVKELKTGINENDS